MQVLTFEMHGITFGIPVEEVVTIETQHNVMPIPGASPHVHGIMNLHGEIIAVYDLASKFHYGTLPIANILVVGMDGMKIGMEVERVNSILELGNDEIIPMPKIMHAGNTCLHEVASTQKKLIVMLDVKQLLSEEEREDINQMLTDHRTKMA
ncbi:MAG: chemotaxis protein CheW [Clostridiales bacterium]|nr:chemotaxis protein CheW [Clostridiales bacterium]